MNMYFIALMLPKELNEKVLHWKKFMYEKHKCKVGLNSPAHITIIPPFWVEANKEPELLHEVDSIAGRCFPFTIRTKNFSAFKPRTIFIDVEKSKALNDLAKRVSDFFELAHQYKIKKEKRAFHPHITIATRDLFKKTFNEAWPIFENEKFEVEWTSKRIICVTTQQKKLGCYSNIPIP